MKKITDTLEKVFFEYAEYILLRLKSFPSENDMKDAKATFFVSSYDVLPGHIDTLIRFAKAIMEARKDS